jgi:A/G-specific adenine glycosylase
MTRPRQTRSRPDPAALIAWYDANHRVLPWRLSPVDRAAGRRPDPYAVWLSEIMLQQTTVAAVKPYFEAFRLNWPTVVDLARTEDGAVMAAWAGLGYYSRARNLLKAARHVAEVHGGRFPSELEALRDLPGVGPYTAAAVGAIAFDLPVVPVDGNVERVTTRLFRIEAALPAARPAISEAIHTIAPSERHGDFAQALMDLGATICTPRSPNCLICPWSDACQARAEGDAERFPVKAAKAERPTRRGIAFVAERLDGAVLLGRRPPKGLLGGMTEVPGSEWRVGTVDGATPPLAGPWEDLPGVVVHVFTHFRLEVTVRRALVPASTPAPEGLWWSSANQRPGEALPTVMKKILAHAGL